MSYPNRFFPFFLLFLFKLVSLSAQQLDMSLFHGLEPRSIGPAGMSGRVTAIDVCLKEPDVLYVGTASGGLWRSEGGGTAWTPLFDSMDVLSIGAVAVQQDNPDVIWVGTGEGNPRNSMSSGAGIFKSIDGGRTWKYMGLGNTRNIHRILIHPRHPNVVFVAALGTAWGDTYERGVYRTKDGGKNWEKVLFVNTRTGAADMDMDPENPNKIFVNMWEYRRWPWFFESGGEGSGLYVTLDGGDSWTKRTAEDGLPSGKLGKIGIAIAPSNPKIVYALVEAEKNALYRSEDGGFTWKKRADRNIGDRPFYYADIAVDPQNENRLYNIYSNVSVSEDGGKTFTTLLGWDNIHGDHHYWWIHPDDPDYLIDGNDGGLAISRDRGKTWRFVENLPVGQFYHISVDLDTPYNIYGGMQDNGTWQGPSQVWQVGGIRNAHWQEIGFGDGFDVVVEKENPRYAWLMWQGGSLFRTDLETGAKTWVKPYLKGKVRLRFNWNAAIAQSPLEPNTIFFGSQFLHKTTDGGRSWQIISPDLTTNDPSKLRQKESGGLTYDVTGAENYCTITAISPSPRTRDVIWVGTDDGNIQVTQDGGRTWTNVADNIPDLPKGSWITQIHATRYKSGEAYVVANNYRRNDWAPYLYRTRNFGKSWERLTWPHNIQSYCLSFTQDRHEPRLLFLGTEHGLYFSIDEGQNWTKWTLGYPSVSTMDMVLHPREQDLVVGTFGRAVYVFDDIRYLRGLAQLGNSLLRKPLFVYPASDAWLVNHQQGAGTRFTGNAYFKGQNRPYGALITFSVAEILNKDKKGNPLKVDTAQVLVLDRSGREIRHFKTAVRKGFNRFSWNLRTDGFRFPGSPRPKADAIPPQGHFVPPGEYTVKVVYGKFEDFTTIQVHPDPRLEVDVEGVTALYSYQEEFGQYVEALAEAINQLDEAKGYLNSSMKLVREQLEDEKVKDKIEEMSKALKKQLQALREEVFPPEDVQGIYRDPDLLISEVYETNTYFNPAGEPNPATAGPSPTLIERAEATKIRIRSYLEEVNDFFETDWKKFGEAFAALQLSPTGAFEPLHVGGQ